MAKRGMGDELGFTGKVVAERPAAAAAGVAVLLVGVTTSVGVTGTGRTPAGAVVDVTKDHECVFPVWRADGEDDREGGVIGGVVTQGSLRRISAAVGRFFWSTESIWESRCVRPGLRKSPVKVRGGRWCGWGARARGGVCVRFYALFEKG